MGIDINWYVIPGALPKTVELLEHYITIVSAHHRWQFKCSDLGLTRGEVAEGLSKMQDGALVQTAFPDLTPDKRELFLTDPKMWEGMEDLEPG